MKQIYKEARKELESKGIDFTKDVYSLTSEQKEILKE